jgi:hypothetical protein
MVGAHALKNLGGSEQRQGPTGRLTACGKALIFLFVLSIPLVKPQVLGDGVGYYAYSRALVVNGNLRFEPDWIHGNVKFSPYGVSRKIPRHDLLPFPSGQYTSTGHLDNRYSIGPALDWTPFLFVTHALVLGYDALGGHIPADGFSWPYMETMAVVTATAGLLGLWLSFLLARKYFPEHWALLAVIAIWLASSAPVYIYLRPSWSHAHSIFAVALFLWYWDRTRDDRRLQQWFVLGLAGSLMIDMYYPNAVLLLVPAMDVVVALSKAKPRPVRAGPQVQFAGAALFGMALALGFLPNLITRWIIYGSPFVTAYFPLSSWHWTSPVLAKVLFSSDHGLFSWTPIVLVAFLGMVPLIRRDRQMGLIFLLCSLAYYYLIASYPDWDGVSSFGNRFFVSLTPIMVLGLAALGEAFENAWHDRRGALIRAWTLAGILILWNLGFIYQWKNHLILTRGEISWQAMVYNQFRVVPEDIASSLERNFVHSYDKPSS